MILNFFGEFLRLRAPVAIAIAALIACGGGEEVTDEAESEPAPVESESDEALDPVEMDDIRPPLFAGVGSVELLGLDLFRISWSAATDDICEPGEIRYKIYHVVEPYEELDLETPSIFTSEPGATSATLAHDAAPGRFYVRAVDRAGNLSSVTAGLLQRSERPIVRASDLTLAARITHCHQTEPGRALCVGDEGFAAWWSDGSWQMLDLGVVAEFRIAATASGLFVYTEVGHLFRFADDGTPEHIDLVFPRRDPVLPFRQFAGDSLGLRYWIDGEGRVFVGADREFLPMSRPLALPGDDCRRLTGLAFGEAASFAVCEEGVVYSAQPAAPGATWLSLTPNAAFRLERGLNGVIASNDTEGMLFDGAGVRRVGVGGWTPLLLTDWVQPGVHPMDVPDEPPEITRVGQVFDHDGHVRAVTDSGLLEFRGAEWSVVDETDGALAGVVAAGSLGTSDEFVTIFEDGAVGQVRRGRNTWIIRRALTGFTRGLVSTDGAAVAFVEGDADGVYVWEDAEWRELRGAPPSRLSIVGMAGSVSGSDLFFFGADRDEGAIWRPQRNDWRAERWLFEPPPEPEPDEDENGEDDLMVFDDGAGFELAPPPPLIGVSADDAIDPPLVEPIRHVDVADDGRAVAVSQHQVWWRLDNGWRLVAERQGDLTAAFVDSGETYVIVEDGAPIRCWREMCGDLVPQTVGGPVAATRVVAGAGGWEVIGSDGSVHRFARASLAPDGLLIDPAVESPVGVWTPARSLGGLAGSMATFVRAEAGEALLTTDGEVYERADGDWVLQAERADVLTLLAVDDRWAILTPRGLFRLGDVRPANRDQPPTP